MASWFSFGSSNAAPPPASQQEPERPASSNRRGRSSRGPSPDPPESSNSHHASSPSTSYHSMRDEYNSNNNNSNSLATAISESFPRRSPRSNNRPRSRPTSPSASPRTTNYRGFSTSIGDMFVHPKQERVDCCAMTCCGVFQSDRDRYLLQGVTPPSPCKRLWVHFIFPLILFFVAGFAAIHVRDVVLNEMLCLLLVGMLVAGFIAQCHKGRAKRIDIRKDVLWYKYQLLQHQNDMSIDQILDQNRRPSGEDCYFMGQTHRDIGCSHPICFALGCYATDRPVQQTAANRGVEVEESLCSCLFKTFCSPICGMHMQCGGVCGMAQESREIENSLLPPAYRRLDYVSMQPMLAYYEDIYNQRWRNFLESEGGEPTVVGPFSEWPASLSQLSKTILQAWAGLTVFLGVWSVVGPVFWTQFLSGKGRRHFFGVADFIIYLCTWVSNGMVFAVTIYFTKNNKQISLDAMMKFFACGFLLSTTLSILYEVIVELLVKIFLLVCMVFSGINIVDDNSYSLQELAQAPLTLGFGGTGRHMENLMAAAEDGKYYLQVFGREHPFLYSFYLFFHAFVVAALIEEICKYFGFRMIEHPDLSLTQQDLEQAACAGVGERVGGDNHGLGEDDNDDYSDEHNVNAARLVGSSATRRRLSSRHRMDFSKHAKSYEAQGASITIAMICVALGFSVCEDLVYIFLYNGSSVAVEVWVLLARSLFPIHPICAAIQSIGVSMRDVEKFPTRFGRIILPAVLLHGTYDFLLLLLDFIDSLHRQDGYNDTDDEFIEAGLCFYLSLVFATLLIAGSLFWLYRQSKRQRERLASYDNDPSSNAFTQMP